jgi:integrase
MKKLLPLLQIKTRSELLDLKRQACETFGAEVVYFGPLEPNRRRVVVPLARSMIHSNGTQAMEARMQDHSLANLVVPEMSGALTKKDCARIERYARRFRAPRTYKVWKTWWTIVACLCEQMGRPLLPMDWETAAAIVTRMADVGYAFGTLRCVRSVMAVAHQYNGLPDPTKDHRFRRVFAGIAKVLGTGSPFRKEAIAATELRAMKDAALECGSTRALQEWTILAVGYFGALRVNEAVALDVEDVHFQPDGSVYLHIRKSKTEQTRSRWVTIDPIEGDQLCPVLALRSWMVVLGVSGGPLFRRPGRLGTLRSARLSDRTVSRIVKRYCARIGLNPEAFSSHSLRAGFITDGIANGVSDLELAYHARQSDLSTLLIYNRPRNNRRNLSQAMLNG